MSVTKELDLIIGKYDRSVSNIIDQIVTELYNRIVLTTPIDTGRARANWTHSLDTVDTTTSESTSYKTISSIGKVPEGKDVVVYIANHLEYVYSLEHGHSGQAPQGMVLTSIEAVRNWVRTKVSA
jgi:hypothetical protein